MRGKREPWSRGMSDPTVAKQTVGHTLLFQVQDDKTKVKTTKPSSRQNQIQDKTKFKTKPSSRRQNQVQDKTKFKTKPKFTISPKSDDVIYEQPLNKPTFSAKSNILCPK